MRLNVQTTLALSLNRPVSAAIAVQSGRKQLTEAMVMPLHNATQPDWLAVNGHILPAEVDVAQFGFWKQAFGSLHQRTLHGLGYDKGHRAQALSQMRLDLKPQV